MKRGFSLIELMAVVVIIASLSSMLFPVLTSAKQSAKSLVCISNLHNIGLSTSLYTTDNDGSLPRATNYFERLLSRPIQLGKPDDIDPATQPTHRQLLDIYAKDKRPYFCPDDKGFRIRDIFESFPHFSTKNDGSSYIFADLYEGQSESTWRDPSNALWATDGSTNWHVPNIDPLDFQHDHINALAYDFHAKTLTNRNAPSFLE